MSDTAWKVCKYGVFSGLYLDTFPAVWKQQQKEQKTNVTELNEQKWIREWKKKKKKDS